MVNSNHLIIALKYHMMEFLLSFIGISSQSLTVL